mmetsp:Transcript_2486/g.3663  ORF Transcript_2486/g.3663 Transcript_2486/m.3663 type:complete len:135 (-) Transcript_2486:491-895(-)
MHTTSNRSSNSNSNKQPSMSKRLKSQSEQTLLPVGFEPSENDVICGTGHLIFGHAGNIRFREIVESRLGEYTNAKRRTDKMQTITSVVEEVQRKRGSFVRFDKGMNRWIGVGGIKAREKTSQQFRDLCEYEKKK